MPTPSNNKKPNTTQSPVWKNKPMLITAALVVLAVGGGATYALWPKNYDKVLADLAAKGPEEVRKAVDSGQVPREVAWEAMGQAREVEMQARMDTFFAIKSPVDRDKYLDTMINEMEVRRKQWEARAATQSSGDRSDRGNRGNRGAGPATQPNEAQRAEREKRRAERSDKTPPEQRAQRAEFMVAMRKRMQERGIQMPGPGGGRGFGGFGGGPGGDPGR